MRAIKRRNERIMGLFLVGVLALNYPLLSIFASGGLLFGIPVLYLYLFIFWAGFIAVAGWMTEAKDIDDTKVPSLTATLTNAAERDAQR
jgi:hypothetical protein